MLSRKKYIPIFAVNTLVFALLIFFRDSGILTLKIYGIMPMLPLALLVAMGVFSGEMSAFFTGLAVGTVLDSVSSAPTGFNAICFMLIGLFSSLMANHIFNKNLNATAALCAICSFFYFLLRFLICDFSKMTMYENVQYILRYILPATAYTTVFVLVFYFLQKKLFKSLY